MSIREAGRARRKFIAGTRLCPPAQTLPSSPCSASRSSASSSVRGAKYRNAAGFICTPLATLGHTLIMAHPELCGSQLEHGKEVCGVLFVARSEPSEGFDAVEEPLDAIAPAIPG